MESFPNFGTNLTHQRLTSDSDRLARLGNQSFGGPFGKLRPGFESAHKALSFHRLGSHRLQFHQGTLLAFAFVGGFHERELLDRFFRGDRWLSGFEELRDLDRGRLVAHVLVV